MNLDFPGKRVLILGLPYFGEILEQQLRSRGWQARFLPHPGRDVRAWLRVARMAKSADAIYLISSRAERRSPQDVLLRATRKPVVIHWVGTDVLIAKEEFDRDRLAQSVVERPVHWCDASWLADELAEMGVRAEYVALPVPGLAAELVPLPEAFRVLLYLPVDAFDREVFDMETILRLPAAFPEIEFTLIPSPPTSLPGPWPANLRAPGWVTDMDALWRETTVYIRLTSHDGMPFTVLEALSRGRQVVFTQPLPHTVTARGFEGVSAALGGLLRAHQAGRLGLNVDGARWARETFDPMRCLDEIDRRLRALFA
ncbi:MAG: hypothetical protein ACKVVT_18950 [Dehalococcoidia bacterium]